ncbi:MAG: YHS domain-containing protein [Verrucomicrobia bacterium]|nr:YHS domain-containing protein [Verrucomicrobiota bacterium]
MNRIQHVYLARHSGKEKHHLILKRKPPTQSVIRFGFVVFALGAFAASNSNAGSLAPVTKDLTQSGLQVWLAKGEHKLNLDSKGVILKGYDPVAYFTQKKAVKGSPKYQTTYQGATYYFSSAADLATFKKSPAKYVPQYGGFCANGIANRQASAGDPTVFFVLKGKLYVCASPEAEKEFQSNAQANVKKADDNWSDAYEWFY